MPKKLPYVYTTVNLSVGCSNDKSCDTEYNLMQTNVFFFRFGEFNA